MQPKDTSKAHLYFSLVKSVFRIAAGLCLGFGSFIIAGVLFVIAEMLGILEEVV